jgi:hypothetical protein
LLFLDEHFFFNITKNGSHKCTVLVKIILYMFFWVFPRRQIEFFRRFGTLSGPDLTEGSETSAKLTLTPGKYPKEHIHDSEHGENVKSRK